MITPLSQENCKKIYGVDFFAAGKATSFGGLPVFLAFLRKIRLKERLEKRFGKPVAKALLQVALGVFMGADTMEAVAECAKDLAINGYLKSPISATQIVRILRRMRPAEIQELHDFSLATFLFDMAHSVVKGTAQSIYIDATAKEKYGRQEGVEFGYVERDTIKRCYQYLLVHHDNLKTLIYGTIRGGSTNSQNNFIGYLNMLLLVFQGEWALTILVDAGFFNEEAFDVCYEHKTFLFVKAPMSEARVAQALSPFLVWSTHEDDDSRAEYAIYTTCTAKRAEWREVFKRVPDPSLKHGYQFSCVATNHMSKGPVAVFAKYNERARIEPINDEMKNDYNLGNIVTKWFHVNDVITQITIILFQLVSHFKRHCLDKADKGKRLATLRKTMFNVPARILSSARRTWLRVYHDACDQLTYARILARIDSLATLLSLAHRLDSS